MAKPGESWDEAWDALPAPKPARDKPVHIVWLFAACLALMLLTLAAIEWPRQAAPANLDPVPAPHDTLTAHFAPCAGPQRTTCAIDGDTIWLSGEKIRIADINAPEITEARCTYELDLAHKATQRLIALLNAGPFSLESPESRDADRYDRKLRIVTRGGRSLGLLLVKEGLAEEWTGHRRNWCEGRG